jgi:hypothetical protein
LIVLKNSAHDAGNGQSGSKISRTWQLGADYIAFPVQHEKLLRGRERILPATDFFNTIR